MVDLALVADVTSAVLERLADVSGGRAERGRLSVDDERQLLAGSSRSN